MPAIPFRPQTTGGIYLAPQRILVPDTMLRMYITAACAFAVILQSSVTDGFSSLWIAFSAVCAALLAQAFVCAIARRHFVCDGSLIVTALVLTMLLPNTMHPGFAAFGVFFAIIVVRYPSGGLGANWLNPALAGALAVRYSWPTVWSASLVASPLDPLILAPELFSVSNSAETVSDYLNKGIFSLFEVQLPSSYVHIFSMDAAGIIADRGLLAMILGSIIIVSCVSFRPWMPLLYLAAYLFLVRVCGVNQEGDMLYALCSGGTLVTAFYLLCEPVTGPKSNAGCIIYALSAGILTFVFRFLNGELYGAFFAVALLNILLPVFRIVETNTIYEKRRTR
jgi:electron transport complex protein RnfD